MKELDLGNVSIELLGHDTVRIKTTDKIIYIDPYVLDPNPSKADLILITHNHFDHCSPEKIAEIQTANTIIIAPSNCLSKLKGNVKTISTSAELNIKDVHIKAVPAYNINKFRFPGVPFHPKEEGVGYLLHLDNVTIYHLGDTDLISSMSQLATENIDVAFIPISGTYVMTIEEAAQAVKVIKPKIAVPMHYGIIIGTLKDAKKFKELVNNKCRIEILK